MTLDTRAAIKPYIPAGQPVPRPAEPAPVQIGVVGLGYWGPNLVRNLNELAVAEPAWMCDVSP
ncbi:MAG TPA: hypothetical protein VGL44_07185, partial [Gaiellales bacterium]